MYSIWHKIWCSLNSLCLECGEKQTGWHGQSHHQCKCLKERYEAAIKKYGSPWNFPKDPSGNIYIP